MLNRTTRKLSLTETGQPYLESVRQILQDIDAADAAASLMSKTPAGTLRIFSSVALGKFQLGALLPQFAAANPEIVLDVTYSDKTVDLVEEGFDSGILIGTVQQFDASMIARQLGVAQTLLVASPEYISKHGAPKHPDDLRKHQSLTYSFESVRNIWRLHDVRDANVIVNVPITGRVISNSGDLLREFALADMGIFILPSFAVMDDISSGRLVRILPDYHLGQLPIILVYPSRRLLSAKVRVFVDFMKARFPDPEADHWRKFSS